MSLIVSLRTTDGVVIAGDSLSTMNAQLNIETELKAACPECDHEFSTTVPLPQLNIPATTLSYAQKVFPYFDYGVGTFGMGQLAGKTMYFATRALEKRLADNCEERPTSVVTAAKQIGDEVFGLLQQQDDFDQIPHDATAVGFQVVGYDGDIAKTVEVLVGGKVRQQELLNTGCSVSGVKEVVEVLWSLGQQDPGNNPVWGAFSLQDSIDYAEFLIRTTADQQRFSKKIASVGGQIDVALVTPFSGFSWIKQKALTKIIDKRGYHDQESK